MSDKEATWCATAQHQAVGPLGIALLLAVLFLAACSGSAADELVVSNESEETEGEVSDDSDPQTEEGDDDAGDGSEISTSSGEESPTPERTPEPTTAPTAVPTPEPLPDDLDGLTPTEQAYVTDVRQSVQSLRTEDASAILGRGELVCTVIAESGNDGSVLPEVADIAERWLCPDADPTTPTPTPTSLVPPTPEASPSPTPQPTSTPRPTRTASRPGTAPRATSTPRPATTSAGTPTPRQTPTPVPLECQLGAAEVNGACYLSFGSPNLDSSGNQVCPSQAPTLIEGNCYVLVTAPGVDPATLQCQTGAVLIGGGCYLAFGAPDLDANGAQRCPSQAPVILDGNCYTQVDPPAEITVLYADCAAAAAAGEIPIFAGATGYGPHLDADNDGIACEEDDDDDVEEG